MSRLTLVFATSILLTGCTGEVLMTPFPPAVILKNYDSGGDIHGVIVYRPQQLIEVDAMTQVPVAGGHVVVAPAPAAAPPSAAAAGPAGPVPPAGPAAGAAPAQQMSNDCEPVLSRKLVTVADWAHPYILHYKHGLLEAYTFGATVTSDGVLTVINSQSTPDQGKTLSNLASTASSIAGLAKKAPPLGSPPCTATPAFLGYETPPDGSKILPYGTTAPY